MRTPEELDELKELVVYLTSAQCAYQIPGQQLHYNPEQLQRAEQINRTAAAIAMINADYD